MRTDTLEKLRRLNRLANSRFKHEAETAERILNHLVDKYSIYIPERLKQEYPGVIAKNEKNTNDLNNDELITFI